MMQELKLKNVTLTRNSAPYNKFYGLTIKNKRLKKHLNKGSSNIIINNVTVTLDVDNPLRHTLIAAYKWQKDVTDPHTERIEYEMFSEFEYYGTKYSAKFVNVIPQILSLDDNNDTILSIICNMIVTLEGKIPDHSVSDRKCVYNRKVWNKKYEPILNDNGDLDLYNKDDKIIDTIPLNRIWAYINKNKIIPLRAMLNEVHATDKPYFYCLTKEPYVSKDIVVEWG